VLFNISLICYDYIASVVDEWIVSREKPRCSKKIMFQCHLNGHKPDMDRPGFEFSLPM